MIIVNLYVAGAQRPLRELLDSGATNNFFRASCLAMLPSTIAAREGRGKVDVKLSHAAEDDFLVIDMNYAFDCILDIPWLSRYQPAMDWLARSVKRRSDFEVNEVFTHLLIAQKDWPHITVVDRSSTTHVVDRASDGPLCTACAVLLRNDPSQRRESEHQVAVEQGLPLLHGLVGHGLPCVEGGDISSSESDSSSSILHSRRRKKKKAKRRRLKPRREPVPYDSPPMESVGVLEYEEGASGRRRTIELASPPRDARSITRLPGLSW
ncbi:hypothetical protein PC123_g15036 [Phytophthora cactorum]|nr:hypothetical protein PC123_g15036 [Phytophthora cactorum]